MIAVAYLRLSLDKVESRKSKLLVKVLCGNKFVPVVRLVREAAVNPQG